MDKIKVYAYWYSNDETLKVENNVIEKLRQVPNIDLILGPTQKEHEDLMKEFPFYKKAIKMNKIAWASNVWRFKKCLEEPGIYIDISGYLDEKKFEVFANYVMKNRRSIYVKEKPHILATGFYYENNKEILKKCLDTYRRVHWWRPVFTFKPDNVPSTKILSRVVHQKRNLNLGNWNEEIYDEFEIWNVQTLFGKRTGYHKKAMASWVPKKNKNDDYFGECLKELRESQGIILKHTLD